MRCISCGDLIPEGRQICWRCEHLVPVIEDAVFCDILDANAYCKKQGWTSYYIKWTGKGYKVGEVK